MVSGLLAGIAGGATVSIVISAIDKFSPVFAGVNKTMLATGAAMTALGVAGLVVTKGLINTAASFETAFTGVRKTVELTESEFEKLRTRFKDLSKEIPVTFEELSKIGEMAGQLGVEGVDNLEKFTKTIAGIAVTTNLTSEEAATSFARIANIMQEPIENVDKMASVVVDLGNNFATTEGEIVTFANRIAGAGNIAGLTTNQILAIGAAFSSVGVQAEAGGTAVQKVLIGMNTATIEGGEKLEIFAKTAGMSSEEFVKAWQQNAGKAFGGFVTGLGEQGDKAITTLSELGLEDQRLVRSFLSLSNAGDLVTDTLKTGVDAWEENTAAIAEAEKRYATTDSQVTILKNKFNSLKDDMGRTLIPAFIKLVDILGNVIGWLEKHPTLTKFAVAAIAIGSALLVIVGPLVMLIAILPMFAAGLGLVSAGFVSLTIAALPVLAPILAIIAALGAAILAYKAFKKFFGKEEDKGINVRSKDGEIFLNATKEQAKEAGVISLNDFILTSSGKIIKPSPQDTIIGTKNPGSLGGSVNIQTGDIYGVDADQVAEALGKEIKKVIRL